MVIIETLENEVGYQLEKLKAYDLVSKFNYNDLDELDRKLYDLFLKIKSEFNKYSPINKDKKIMLVIEQTIDKLVSTFVISHSSPDLKNLQTKIHLVL